MSVALIAGAFGAPLPAQQPVPDLPRTPVSTTGVVPGRIAPTPSTPTPAPRHRRRVYVVHRPAVAPSYVETDTGAIPVTARETVTRVGPGLEFEAVSTVPPGRVLRTSGCDAGWCLIGALGRATYVLQRDLTALPPTRTGAMEPSPAAPAAIGLREQSLPPLRVIPTAVVAVRLPPPHPLALAAAPQVVPPTPQAPGGSTASIHVVGATPVAHPKMRVHHIVRHATNTAAPASQATPPAVMPPAPKPVLPPKRASPSTPVPAAPAKSGTPRPLPPAQPIPGTPSAPRGHPQTLPAPLSPSRNVIRPIQPTVPRPATP